MSLRFFYFQVVSHQLKADSYTAAKNSGFSCAILFYNDLNCFILSQIKSKMQIQVLAGQAQIFIST